MSDEMVDVVDEFDIVVGLSEKHEAHALGKRIRIVHVFIFDKQGRMLVQLRSGSVRFCPHHWVTAGSGHVQSGETYAQAGDRELQEEMGIQTPLTFEGTERYRDELSHEEFLGILRGTFDGEIRIHPEDVERSAFFTLDELREMILRGEKMHPEFLFLLRQRFGL